MTRRHVTVEDGQAVVTCILQLKLRLPNHYHPHFSRGLIDFAWTKAPDSVSIGNIGILNDDPFEGAVSFG